jgi:membrane fusion protein (multidrug efflux system)
VVARRNVEVGQLVGPERPLLAIVPLEDVWVVANFKEDQLRDMKPGAKATIEVDAFGEKLPAFVESVAPGTGSRFALLPPDNASGNFVKVVQRVPVLLRFESKPKVALRPGMSAVVKVTVRE